MFAIVDFSFSWLFRADMVTQNLGDLAEVQQKAGEVDIIQTSSAALRLEIECLKSEIFMVTSERDCDSGDMADIILERIVSQIVQEDATSQLRLKELELHQALCVSSGPEEAMQPKFEGTFESSSQHKGENTSLDTLFSIFNMYYFEYIAFGLVACMTSVLAATLREIRLKFFCLEFFGRRVTMKQWMPCAKMSGYKCRT